MGNQGFNWVQLFTAEPETAFSYRPWVLRRPHPVKKGSTWPKTLRSNGPKEKRRLRAGYANSTLRPTEMKPKVTKGWKFGSMRKTCLKLSDGEFITISLSG